jgi:NTE family protein
MIAKFLIWEIGVSVIGFRRRTASGAGISARPSSRQIRQQAAKSKRPLGAGLLAAVLALGACASAQVPMNEPLVGAERNSVDRPQDANAAGGRADLLVFVAFSGGGKRSAAFGHGVLRGLRDVPVRTATGQTRLLDEVDVVSGVSGGSFPAAHFALHGDKTFETFPEEFLHQDINAFIFGTFLLPWNWEWLVNPYFGTNDRMATIYDRLMFRGATYDSLRPRPSLSVNATDISFGLPFGFTSFQFDILCSDLGSFPLARAVAASNGFPVVFSPITLRNHRGAACPAPAPVRPDLAAARANLRTRAIAQSIERYLDAGRTPWVHLMDGGIADNLAMRTMLNTLILVEQQAATFSDMFRPIRRILLISVDGQAASNPSLPEQRVVTGLGQILGAVSGTQIDSFNVETLMLAEEQVKRLASAIARTRCAAAPTIDNRPCDDVKGDLVRISLSEFPDQAERQTLQAIPTGLTIERRFVEMLVRAGEEMARNDRGLAEFLAQEPPPPAQVAARPSGRRR